MPDNNASQTFVVTIDSNTLGVDEVEVGLTNNGNIIWEPGLYNNIADFNLDGVVNLKDFGDFADTWLWQTGWY